MRVGIFDSGLGGLTIVKEIAEVFKGAELFYIADTKFAPYGDKNHDEILNQSLKIAKYFVKNFEIDALIVACNTATSAAIKVLREEFSNLIVIGCEPGIKPAINCTDTNCIGILATKATLKGEKYQSLVNLLDPNKNIKLFEQACVGLVEKIEDGKIEDESTNLMLNTWLKPMKENMVDTIVLGCTHYPLISKNIKEIMGNEIKIIETGTAISRRLIELSMVKNHKNIGKLDIIVFYTNGINKKMVDFILDDYIDGGKIIL